MSKAHEVYIKDTHVFSKKSWKWLASFAAEGDARVYLASQLTLWEDVNGIWLKTMQNGKNIEIYFEGKLVEK